MATIGFDNTVRVWEARTGAELLTIKGHTKDGSTVSFSRDGTQILSGASDGTVRIWDASVVKRDLPPT